MTSKLILEMETLTFKTITYGTDNYLGNHCRRWVCA